MRKSGILMHISSLPSAYGIGKMGKNAYAFADFLSKSGIEVWQVLPLTPTSYGDSPYQSFSVFAGNPYFIDFELLEEQGYLHYDEYASVQWETDPQFVNYECIYKNCLKVLRIAYQRFDCQQLDYMQFCKDEARWLNDYALFMALKDKYDGKPWYEWEEPMAYYWLHDIRMAEEEYEDEIEFYKVLQFWFYQQWYLLKEYCNSVDVSVIGDIPIYVSHDSVDVWAHPEMFLLDKKGMPQAVAGCPPDEFSPTGQLWGNPLYNWRYQREEEYEWWIDRLVHAHRMYNAVRIDHFRGFESYYAIPYGNKTAEIGMWQSGPGMDLFSAIQARLGPMLIIAEDLGFVTQEVRDLLDRTGYPGMKVMQFAFDGNPKNEYLPQNFASPNCVVYTGTHDNMTLRGWVNMASAAQLRFAKQYLHCRSKNDLPVEIIRAAWSSTSMLAIAQIQDFLDVGEEGRMNTPSTLGRNWQYRTQSSDFTENLSKRIYRMNELYNRLPEEDVPSYIARARRKAKKPRTKQKPAEHSTTANANNDVIREKTTQKPTEDAAKKQETSSTEPKKGDE